MKEKDLLIINMQLNEFHSFITYGLIILLPASWPELSWNAFQILSSIHKLICLGSKSVLYVTAVQCRALWLYEWKSQDWGVTPADGNYPVCCCCCCCLFSLWPGEKRSDGTDRVTWPHYKESLSSVAKAKAGRNYYFSHWIYFGFFSQQLHAGVQLSRCSSEDFGILQSLDVLQAYL